MTSDNKWFFGGDMRRMPPIPVRRKRTNRMSSRPRDNMRTKVYDWENRTLHNSGHSLAVDYRGMKANVPMMSKRNITKLVGEICERYGVDAPPIRFSQKGQSAKGGKAGIILPPWSWNKSVVIHEAAHAVHSNFGMDSCAFHGPEFLRLVIDLYAWQGMATMQKLNKTAKAAGLTVGPRKIKPAKHDWKSELQKDLVGLVMAYRDKIDEKDILEIIGGTTWQMEPGPSAQGATERLIGQ